MNRRWLIGALTALPVVAGAQSLDSLKGLLSSTDPIVGALKSALGVTDNQAQGGLGSILTLAQEHLAKGDFDKNLTGAGLRHGTLLRLQHFGAARFPDRNGLHCRGQIHAPPL